MSTFQGLQTGSSACFNDTWQSRGREGATTRQGGAAAMEMSSLLAGHSRRNPTCQNLRKPQPIYEKRGFSGDPDREIVQKAEHAVSVGLGDHRSWVHSF